MQLDFHFHLRHRLFSSSKTLFSQKMLNSGVLDRVFKQRQTIIVVCQCFLSYLAFPAKQLGLYLRSSHMSSAQRTPPAIQRHKTQRKVNFTTCIENAHDL